MHAIVRANTYGPVKLAQSRGELDAFQALHARQPGCRGTVVADLGGGRQMVVNLWETEDHAAVALASLIPEVRRVLEPLMAEPSEPIGSGPVLLTDLARAG